MWRAISGELEVWKEGKERRVLLLRGARQVGKTWAVRELGRSFRHFLEVNFELDPRLASLFEDSLDARQLGTRLSAYSGVPVKAGETLLFLDEVQACPRALASLRFFQEQLPGLHVVAAGSLLDLVLARAPSFGVGRITIRRMYPLSFVEYLHALDASTLVPAIEEAGPERPLVAAIHEKLLDHLRMYLLIGGMPAVVGTFVRTRDIQAAFDLQDDLVATFRSDFAKYKERAPVDRLRAALDSICLQAGGKFKFSAIESEASYRPLREALGMLIQAGLAHRVPHTSAGGIPLGAQVNPRRYKVLPFDVGILQRIAALDVASHMVASSTELVNRGSLAEVFVGNELVAHASSRREPGLFYWHREARNSQAELDYVVQVGDRILPIEVKAGRRGGMKSLRRFLEERDLDVGIRISAENFARFDAIRVVPLYAVHVLRNEARLERLLASS